MRFQQCGARSLIRVFASRISFPFLCLIVLIPHLCPLSYSTEYFYKFSMTIKLQTQHHLDFLILKGGCTGSSESSLFKMPHFENHMSRLIRRL